MKDELKITIMPHKDDRNKSCAVFIEGFETRGDAEYFTQMLMRLDEIEFKEFNRGNDNER